MIKSMTGFASMTREDEIGTLTVTARSVNHRHLDIQIRAPQALLAMEHTIRERIQLQLARGRVEVGVSMSLKTAPPVEVEIDEALVNALVSAAARLEVVQATTGTWTVGELLRFPHVVTVTEQARGSESDTRVEAAVTAAIDDVVSELDAMRRKEGDFLRVDLAERLSAFGSLVEQIATGAAAGDETLRERLSARVAELATEVSADPAALAQEVVRWVARSDIHEELARLRAHIAHWGDLADAPEPCGRTLDFLLQEMNREINTIGSKADGTETSALVVAAKAELEKLREQTQNVE